MHLPKPTECMTLRVKSKMDYGLWVIMMCPCRLVSCDKCTPLVGDNGRGSACMAGRI